MAPSSNRLRGGARAAIAGLGLLAALIVPTSLPTPAQACGGLFCNSAQPVVQAGENILFVRDGATTHMIVRLSYQGPPIGFGWLLPVPPDVSSRTASAQLFSDLDDFYRPTFSLESVFAEGCEPRYEDYYGGDGGGGGAGGSGGEGGGGPPPVQVISREVVGPYEQVVLRARLSQDLSAWLTENGFQSPPGTDALLQPYLDLGSAVLALRLTADATDQDVVPIHLTFTGDTPAIPLRPTAVAAQPDMGIAVHLLGPARAVPLNYPHVIINDAAIDWQNFGENYVDVVSQAADEAGGRAFVTDAASAWNGIYFQAFIPTDAVLNAVRAAETLGELVDSGLVLRDADVARIVPHHFTPPAGVTAAEYLRCLGCSGDDWTLRAFDGAAFADELERDVLASRRLLEGPLERNPYLTRLFTTMSAEEMSEDPIFGFNADLEDVSPNRSAEQHIGCTDGEPDYERTVIVTRDGQRIATGAQAPAFIQRQDGLTVRGADTRAAGRIERMFAAGQPELIADYTPTEQGAGGAGGSVVGATTTRPTDGRMGDGDGCGMCAMTERPAPVVPMALLLGLLGLTRRRR